MPGSFWYLEIFFVVSLWHQSQFMTTEQVEESYFHAIFFLFVLNCGHFSLCNITVEAAGEKDCCMYQILLYQFYIILHQMKLNGIIKYCIKNIALTVSYNFISNRILSIVLYLNIPWRIVLYHTTLNQTVHIGSYWLYRGLC